MVNKTLTGVAKEFEQLVKTYKKDDKSREKIINLSREIIKPAKQAIYALHRNEIGVAEKLLEGARQSIEKAHQSLIESNLKDVGAFNAGLEEFVEAKSYHSFLTANKLLKRKELGLSFEIRYETYLAALSDTSGELLRRGVIAATKKEYETVKHISIVIEELFGLFLQIDLRTGELRKKTDSIKYNLAKIQSIVYDLSLQKTK